MSLEMIKNDRNKMLNFLKGIGCIGVVFIHVAFPGLAGEVISGLAQFAVPVFLMVAGYYAFGCSESVIKRRLFKILKIFVFAYLCFFAYRAVFQLKNGTIVEWLATNFSYKTIIKYVVFCTIDFAIPLWYLIAMIETYLFWFFVVKYRKENQILKMILVLFVLQVLSITICETNGFPWFYKTNFVTRALPWFLFGYWIHSKGEIIIKKRNDSILGLAALAGAVIVLVPIVQKTTVKFSCVGIVFFAIALFLLAVKHPKKTISKVVEYIGDRLSLNIYIFHSILAGVIDITFKKMLKIDIAGGMWYQWLKPILTLGAAIFLAFLIEKMNGFKINQIKHKKLL